MNFFYIYLLEYHTPRRRKPGKLCRPGKLFLGKRC